jgi:hypothetical protein
MNIPLHFFYARLPYNSSNPSAPSHMTHIAPLDLAFLRWPTTDHQQTVTSKKPDDVSALPIWTDEVEHRLASFATRGPLISLLLDFAQ